MDQPARSYVRRAWRRLRTATTRATLGLAVSALSACSSGDGGAESVSGGAVEVAALEGRIVFSAGDFGGDIFVSNADGSERKRLTDHPAADFDPSWSPDGRMIAFRSHRDEGDNNEIYVMNADGGGLRNLTRDPAIDYSPAWSPDGRRIAFASGRAGDSANEIYVVNVDGTGLTRLTNRVGIDEYPTWSPDGKRFAFICTGSRVLEQGVGDFEICVVDSGGGEVVQLTDSPGVSQLPDWSPGGQSIAFESDRNGWPTLPDYRPPSYTQDQYGDMEIFVVDADGSDQRNLTENPRQGDRMPAWSPDGRFIVFSRDGDLFVLKHGEENATRLTATGSDAFPDWIGAPRR